MTRGSRPTSDVLVLDGDTRGGLAAVRALGRGGLTVTMASGAPRSRHAAERVLLPSPADGLDAFTSALLAHLRERPAAVVLTASDAGVEALRRARGALEGLSVPALAPDHALDVATSKERTVELAASLGVPVPRSIRVQSVSAAVDAVAEVGVPCVLKPDRSWQDGGPAGGRRVASMLVTSPAEAREGAEHLVGPGRPALVQELVSGPNEWLMLFRQGVAITARFAARVARTWPPLGGNDVLRGSVPLPSDAVAHAERLLAAMGYEGFAHVEFRRAPDGRPVLMEVNPRLTQSIELALHAGVDFARMQVDWARGESPAPSDGYRAGVRLAWAAGELKLLAGAVLRPAPPQPPAADVLRGLARDYRRPPRLDGIALDDPLPTVRAIGATVGDVMRPVRARLRAAR